MTKILFSVLFSAVFLTLSVFAQSESMKIPNDWQTFAEQTNYRKTPRYAETIEYSRRLAKSSDLIIYQPFGKSGEGRDLPLLIAATGKTLTPEAARKKGKAVVLIQACIHAGESDGKDAGLALLRDIAITKTRLNLLDNVVILYVPIYNVDGHELFSAYNRINQVGPDEMGFRGTSSNLNLNRDYMKADAPETRAFLKLWNEWKPDFFIDSHVTDGADFRYNITYEFAHFEEVSPFIKNWMNEIFERKVVPKVEKEGNLLTHYLEFNGREVSSGVTTFIATPRFATGYAALRNRAGLLIESHSLKPYKSRVRGTYDVFWKTLEEINLNKESLFEANRQADAETIRRGQAREADPNYKFPLRFQFTKNSVPFAFKGVEYRMEDSEISGAKRIVYGTKPLDVTIPKFDEVKVAVAVAPPLYYIIPPQWQSVIEVLQAHGIRFERTSKPLQIEVESYYLTEPKWSPASFENRLPMNYKTNPVKEMREFPANSAVVPLNQETGNVIVHLLEPQSGDSFAAWGFFNAIFEQKEYFSDYIMEDIAREMMAKDELLRKEFEAKLKDENFRKSAGARLRFFYEHSPYFDKRIGLYPVGRIMTKPGGKL
jgi:hypothetical protein